MFLFINESNIHSNNNNRTRHLITIFPHFPYYNQTFCHPILSKELACTRFLTKILDIWNLWLEILHTEIWQWQCYMRSKIHEIRNWVISPFSHQYASLKSNNIIIVVFQINFGFCSHHSHKMQVTSVTNREGSILHSHCEMNFFTLWILYWEKECLGPIE